MCTVTIMIYLLPRRTWVLRSSDSRIPGSHSSILSSENRRHSTSSWHYYSQPFYPCSKTKKWSTTRSYQQKHFSRLPPHPLPSFMEHLGDVGVIRIWLARCVSHLSLSPLFFSLIAHECGSMIFFIISIVSFIWRSGSTTGPFTPSPPTPTQQPVLGYSSSTHFLLGLVYFCAIVKTLYGYGRVNEMARVTETARRRGVP
ncbi:hypothetical protein BKA82DRAFT_4011384 [Pisolithus tinctorius]|nr:hypothetical protein BKA82DRAFT_4011384 [Pisolithus tinctorius]